MNFGGPTAMLPMTPYLRQLLGPVLDRQNLASFDEDAAFVSDGGMSQVSTTILAVHFANGTTLAAKQEAVDLIAGRVIGGVAISEEGLYYIQVEGDGTIATIDSIAAVLRGR